MIKNIDQLDATKTQFVPSKIRVTEVSADNAIEFVATVELT